MKNFIDQVSFNRTEITGYHDTLKTCCKAARKIAVKNQLQIVAYNVMSQVEKLGLCYKALSSFMFMLVSVPAVSAQQEKSYALHANIIYRFTKYINWPVDLNSVDFVIGIVGDTPLYLALENFVANKTVGNQRIVVKKMSPTAKMYTCNILFICQDKGKILQKIAEITKGSPILIISENNARALPGSCINFVIVNEHLKLEINKTNIEDRNLNIASELLRLGTIVK